MLNNEIVFFTNSISACCSGFSGPIYVNNYKGQKINWDEILEKKEKWISLLQQGLVPEGCKNCNQLGTYKESTGTKFSRLVIKHYSHCNASCIYCSEEYLTKGKITNQIKKSDYYDLLPLVKELYKEDLIDNENLVVEFQGGDISVLEESQKIIEEFLKHNLQEIIFLTNNITYQPIIDKSLKLNKGRVVISLDCGCRDTFKKIKRVDKFDDSVENLKLYLKNTNSSEYILVKYIIVQNVNDNLEELNKFIDLMIEIGVKRMSLEIDFRDILMNKSVKFEIPEHYYELFELFYQRCRESDVEASVWPYTLNLLNQSRERKLSKF